MAKFSKSIEELKKAPIKAYYAMIEWVEYFNSESELKTAIIEIFKSPILCIVLDRLADYIEKRVRACIELKSAGYTSDDAFTLYAYEAGGI